MKGSPRHSVKWRKHDRKETYNIVLFIQENAEQHTRVCRHVDNTSEDHISSGRGVGTMEEIDKKKVQ